MTAARSIDPPLLVAGELTFGLIKSEVIRRGWLGEVLDAALSVPLAIVGAYRTRLSTEQLLDLFAAYTRKPGWPELIDSVAGDVVALALCGRHAVRAWQDLLGPSDPAQAKPPTLRARFGDFEKPAHNVAYASENHAAARRDLALFFPPLIRLDR